MKVLHINKQSRGGAFKAAFRQHLALIDHGVESHFLTMGELNSDIPNHLNFFVNRSGYFKRVINNRWLFKTKRNRHLDLLKKLEMKPNEVFTFPDSDYDLSDTINQLDPDIINLHWVAGFLDIQTFFEKVKKPIVWTLHDMNPFLGGYHYDGVTAQEWEAYSHLEKRNKEIKRKHYPDLIHVAAPSRWLFNASQSSDLLGKYEHSYIPYSLPTETFHYKEQREARSDLGFEENVKILLFVADKVDVIRKGADLLIGAFKHLQQDEVFNKAKIVAVGERSIDLDPFPFIQQYGFVTSEEEMSKLYAAADCFIMPSRMDNLPNVMLESTACGTPIIAFNIGGVPDVVVDGENGVLVNDLDDLALAKGIKRFVEMDLDRKQISQKTISNFSSEKQVQRFIGVYESLLQ